VGEFNLKQVNQKLDSIQADVIALEGITAQYWKSGMYIAEIGMTGYWALEINTDFAPPTTSEIYDPGIVNVWRIRSGAADYQVVTDRVANESAGTIYTSEVLDEPTWNVGDLAKVIFSGAIIRTDEEPSEAITANIAGGVDDVVTVLDSDLYQVGWLIKVDANKGTKNVTEATGGSSTVITDATITEAVNYWAGGEVTITSGTYTGQTRAIVSSAVGSVTVSPAFPGNIAIGVTATIYSPKEYRTITAINDGIHLTVDSVFTNSYTTALGATVTRVIQHNLTTAVFFTSLVEEAASYKILYQGTLTTGSATVPADTTAGAAFGNDYFNGSWLMPIAGACHNQPRLIVDFATTTGIYTIDSEQPFTASTGTVEYIVLGNNSQLAPVADSLNNQTPAQIIGNKTDTTVPIVSAAASNTAYLKALAARGMSIIRAKTTSATGSQTSVISTDLIGYGTNFFNDEFYMQAQSGVAKPEIKKITAYATAAGQFTVDAFSVALSSGDDILIIHESLVSIGRNDADNVFDSSNVVANDDGSIFERLEWLASMVVIAKGTFTTSSATVPADTGRTEANDYFNGSWLMPIGGTPATAYLQPRLIVDFTTTTGVFTLDPEHPFTSAPGLVEYVILSPNDSLVPAINGTNNYTPAHVIGNKTDTADFTWDVLTSSLVKLVKGVLGVEVIEEGTFTTSSATVPADTAIGALYADDYFNGSWLMAVSGSNAFQPRLIVDFATTTGIFTLDPEQPFNNAPGLVSYVVLSRNTSLVPIADGINNNTPAHVVGNKASTAIYASTNTADIIRYLKGILGSMVIGTGTFTTSSATVPADTSQGGKVSNYYNGALLVPVAGADVFQPRLIVGFTTATGVFTMDPSHPFTAATGLVDYVILAAQGDLIPTANNTDNTTLMDVVGNKTDSATLDDMSALATATIVAEVKRILLRMSTDAFTANIQGAARTELDTMLAQLATYLSAAGAAWSVQVNNNTARTNIEQTLEDFFGVVGCDGTNVFEPSIGGSTRTTIEAAFAALGTAFGAEYDGTPDLYDTIVTGYDSSAITANPDGSVMERLEDLHGDVSNISGGLAYKAICTSDGTATTAIASGMIGYGNDVFNDKYYIQIIYNASGAGTSPEPKTRKITDYESVSGTFTFATVTDAPITNDIILIFHESLAATGRNGADSDFSSSSVVANENGTILERLEQIQEATNIGTGSSLPANKSLYDIIGTAYVDAGGGFGTDSINSDLTAIDTEVETVSLAQAGGNRNSNVRAGLLLRWIADAVFAISGINTYQEVIPDTYFSKAAIDTTLTNPPPTPDVDNTIVQIDAVVNTVFNLRGLWINTTSFGTGTTITYTLWLQTTASPGAPVAVDSVVVSSTGWQSLMDLFGLQEVNSMSIYVTAVTDVGNTGAASGYYHYASAT
jgi:hypothetical protein